MTPALPKWTDAQAVTTYLTSILATVVAIVAALHPGFTEPPIVQAILPTAGVLVAGIAQLVNVVTHRSAHASALAAGTAAAVSAAVAGVQAPPSMAGTAIAQR